MASRLYATPTDKRTLWAPSLPPTVLAANAMYYFKVSCQNYIQDNMQLSALFLSGSLALTLSDS